MKYQFLKIKIRQAMENQSTSQYRAYKQNTTPALHLISKYSFTTEYTQQSSSKSLKNEVYVYESEFSGQHQTD
ncbi:hypothetical protein ACT3CD_12680 [Geofilum sp. OHC36d9]|uniref:hypothetical protein n=1 Tax=Geofilum sp. OHC36d9 TaxID=3458413 RepID=UPI0040343332